MGINKHSQTLNEKGLKVSKLFKKGTLLITIAANIGYAGILEYDMACPDSLIGLKCKNILNSLLNYLLQIEQPKMDYLAVAAAQKNINIEFLKPYKFIVPVYQEEQEKIASFLTSIDQKIEKLTKKKELLKEYKKGVMQKVFSQEIRFKDTSTLLCTSGEWDFSEWEEKTLGEVTNIIMGQSPDSRSYNNDKFGVLLIQGNADIKNRKSKPRQWTSEPTKLCEIGDLILTVRAPVGAIAKSLHNACIGRGVCSIKNNILSNIEFLYQFLLSFEKKWIKYEQGSTFSAVSSKDIKTLKLKLPSVPEQEKIADFLSGIDEKIDIISRQLEDGKVFKKGLLQKMFV